MAQPISRYQYRMPTFCKRRPVRTRNCGSCRALTTLSLLKMEMAKASSIPPTASTSSIFLAGWLRIVNRVIDGRWVWTVPASRREQKPQHGRYALRPGNLVVLAAFDFAVAQVFAEFPSF